MLHLEREVFQYEYLSHGGCSYVLTMEDDKQFNITLVSHTHTHTHTHILPSYPPQKAMEVIGFAPEDISSILEMLAAILNLGNVKFTGFSLPNGTDACKVEESLGINIYI